jgi:hypothetical protein
MDETSIFCPNGSVPGLNTEDKAPKGCQNGNRLANRTIECQFGSATHPALHEHGRTSFVLVDLEVKGAARRARQNLPRKEALFFCYRQSVDGSCRDDQCLPEENSGREHLAEDFASDTGLLRISGVSPENKAAECILKGPQGGVGQCGRLDAVGVHRFDFQVLAMQHVSQRRKREHIDVMPQCRLTLIEWTLGLVVEPS